MQNVHASRSQKRPLFIERRNFFFLFSRPQPKFSSPHYWRLLPITARGRSPNRSGAVLTVKPAPMFAKFGSDQRHVLIRRDAIQDGGQRGNHQRHTPRVQLVQPEPARLLALVQVGGSQVPGKHHILHLLSYSSHRGRAP